MALPSGIATVTVTVGPYLSAGGAPANGRVRFVPEGQVLHTPSGSVILPDSATVDLVAGAGSVTLVASDAAGVTPNPFAYWVFWELQGATSPEPRRILLPAAVPTVDVDALLTTTSATGTIAVPTVTSVAGLAGAPTAQQLVTALDTPLKATLGIPRRESLPGLAGRLTAYTGTAPTVTLSAGNAASSITAPDFVGNGDDGFARDDRWSIIGAKLAWAQDDASASTPSSVVPTNGTSFQPYRVGGITDAPKLEFCVRGNTVAYRVWVDGHPLSLTSSNLPGGGAFYNIIVNFSGVRKMRRVELEIDSGHIYAMVIATGDLLMPAPVPGIRGVIVGDSFVEGTGADNRFTSWPNTFGQLCGWAEIVVSGSGGTGYIVDGAVAVPGRQNFFDRFDETVTVHSPDVVVISGGRNDLGTHTAAEVGTAAASLLSYARGALPHAQLVLTSPVPANNSEITSFAAAKNSIKAAADAAGALFLDVVGQSYMTGVSANLTGGDAVHPTQSGHDALALALFQRYAALLPA